MHALTYHTPPYNFSKTTPSPALGGVKTSAIAEVLAFHLLALAVDILWGGGNRFADIAPHPYWIIVLLVTVQYGIAEALMAAAASSLFFLAGNMPEYNINQTMYDYSLAVITLPLQWLAVAAILGGLRNRQRGERETLQEKLRLAEEKSEVIASSYTSLKALKENLEMRLAQESQSLLKVYNCALTLGFFETHGSYKALEEVIRDLLHPVKFSVFMLENGKLKRVLDSGWEIGDDFRTEFSSKSALYGEIVGQKKILCSLHAGGEKTLAGQGLLAGPIIDPQSGTVHGMIKIEEQRLAEMGPRSMEIFKILCEWFGLACARRAAAAPKPVGEKRFTSPFTGKYTNFWRPEHESTRQQHA